MLQYNLHKSTDIIIDGHVPKFNFIHFFKEERVLQKKLCMLCLCLTYLLTLGSTFVLVHTTGLKRKYHM